MGAKCSAATEASLGQIDARLRRVQFSRRRNFKDAPEREVRWTVSSSQGVITELPASIDDECTENESVVVWRPSEACTESVLWTSNDRPAVVETNPFRQQARIEQQQNELQDPRPEPEQRGSQFPLQASDPELEEARRVEPWLYKGKSRTTDGRISPGGLAALLAGAYLDALQGEGFDWEPRKKKPTAGNDDETQDEEFDWQPKKPKQKPTAGEDKEDSQDEEFDWKPKKKQTAGGPTPYSDTEGARSDWLPVKGTDGDTMNTLGELSEMDSLTETESSAEGDSEWYPEKDNQKTFSRVFEEDDFDWSKKTSGATAEDKLDLSKKTSGATAEDDFDWYPTKKTAGASAEEDYAEFVEDLLHRLAMAAAMRESATKKSKRPTAPEGTATTRGEFQSPRGVNQKEEKTATKGERSIMTPGFAPYPPTTAVHEKPQKPLSQRVLEELISADLAETFAETQESNQAEGFGAAGVGEADATSESESEGVRETEFSEGEGVPVVVIEGEPSELEVHPARSFESDEHLGERGEQSDSDEEKVTMLSISENL